MSDTNEGLENVNFGNYICPDCKGKENEEHICDRYKDVNLVDEKIDRTIHYPICRCPRCYPSRVRK